MIPRIGAQPGLFGIVSPINSGGYKYQLSGLAKTKNEPAAIVELSLKSREKVSAQDIIEPQAAKRANANDIFSFLSSTASRLESLQKSLDDALLTDEQRTVINKEIESVTQEYQNTINSKEFSLIKTIANSVVGSLAGGANSTAIANSLGSYSSLLGSGFLGLVQSGNLTALSQLSTGVNKISEISVNDLVSSRDAVSSLKENAELVLPALRGGEKEFKQGNTSQGIPIVSSVNPYITQTQFSYVDQSGTGIALQTFTGKDLIKAAKAGIPVDQISNLIYVNAPSENDLEKEKEEAIGYQELKY